ncbi:MAG: PHP domain-containing protein [Acidiferrobacterales bacterium]
MRTIYDLHSHTLESDGTLTPTELVERAARMGVQVLALTDHDVTHGIAEAQTAAEESGLQLVPGVEISVTWQGRTLHIIGLGVDVENTELATGLANLRQRRNERGREIGQRLESAGVENAYAGARSYSHGDILSRTHFARFLVDNNYAKDVGRAFKKYLSNGKAGYVRCEWVGLEECIGWINGAGGQAVIAHPGRYAIGSGTMRRLLGEFRDAGGAGIEVVCGNNNSGEIDRFARLANDFGLLASCGSDFHGPEQHWRELGRLTRFPEGCRPVWQDWR